ncbi:MAG: citrate/2-methylcitrate synthase [Clostridia bacterium]|nr:citrate/2-methylcitrate synthase [Clostridia bacterium]
MDVNSGNFEAMSERIRRSCVIDPELYAKYEVKRGLRDISGRGVLVGLTDISDVHAYILDEGDYVPCEGRLFYRGIDVADLVNGFQAGGYFGFEEAAYLLLFGELPDRDELGGFQRLLEDSRALPDDFVRDLILKAPSRDMMNLLARSVLALYSYDDNPDDISLPNVLRQSIDLIARFPLLALYGYQAFAYYHNHESLHIHAPLAGLSTAETILRLLRPDGSYTAFEARALDLALVLHAEHGGGNNSTFTTRVVTSSATDTYSAVAAALGSLKGPRHGGANIKVVQMFEDIKAAVRDWDDEDEVAAYLDKILSKEAFDRTGLIYGMGHAVYSLSDPRAVLLKRYVGELAAEKGVEPEFRLYDTVERKAADVIARNRRIYKGVSANVDLYSGFLYGIMGIPTELFTPIFAIARIAGWSIHRLEELVSGNKIIRPAYKNLSRRADYVPIDRR